MSRIRIVAAIGKNRVLGKDNQLLWHIPDDLKRFKELTVGHPVIMGRKTFESILAALHKPLPGRTNIVVSRQYREPTSGDKHVVWVTSLEEAINEAKKALGGEEIFIGGGAEIYQQALPFADKLYLTIIDDEKEGDAYFPEYKEQFPTTAHEEGRSHEGLTYRWMDLER